MALETQTISSAEIKPLFSFDLDAGQELGTAHADADDFFDFPLLSYTMPYESASLEVAPNRVGHYGQIETQGRHRRDLSTWTMDASFLGTPNVIKAHCLWMWGDGDGTAALTPAIGIGNGAAGDMQMNHNATSNNHTTCILRNGGTDATSDDMIIKGLIPTSVTFKQDVGANAGQLTIDTSFFTAYAPTEAANTIAVDTTDTGTPHSIFNLNTGSQAGAINLGGEDLMPLSWEITVSRTIERVGSQNYSTFLPYAYAQTGAWEVTGSITVKADDNTYDLRAATGTPIIGGSAGVNLSIDEANNFTIDLPDVMIDAATLDNGGTNLTHTIPFRAFAANTTGNILSIDLS